MKKVVTLLCLFVSFTTALVAQTPQGINYQVIARDNDGNPITNQSLEFTININHSGSSFSETQTVTSNDFGLCQFVIGSKSDLSDFTWEQTTTISISAKADGNTYNLGSNVPFQSVPYALYSHKAENLKDFDISTANEGEIMVFRSGQWVAEPLSNGGGNGVSEERVLEIVEGEGYIKSADDGDTDDSNEIQELSLDGDQLTLSNGGNTITLPSGGPLDASEVETIVTDAGFIKEDTQLSEQEVKDIVTTEGYLTTENDGDDQNELISSVEEDNGDLVITEAGVEHRLPFPSGGGARLTDTEVETIVTDAGFTKTDTTLTDQEVIDIVEGEGYKKLEEDPIYSSSPAFGVRDEDIDNWNNKLKAPSSASSGDVLAYNGSSGEWVAQPNSSGPTYTAGDGIDLAGNEITNTGDIDATDDVLKTDVLGGDVSGTYDAVVVESIQGKPVDATTPTDGQILKYNNNQWEVTDDVTNTTEAIQDTDSPTNIDVSTGDVIITNSTGSNMVYDNTGNLGIGSANTSPTNRLTVTDNTTSNYVTSIQGGSDANGLSILVDNNSASKNILQANSQGTTGLIVRADGNVGVGTDSPSEKLDVDGNVRIRGTVAPTVGQVLTATDVNGTAAWQDVSGDNLGDHTATKDLYLNTTNDLLLREDEYHGLGWYGDTKPFDGVNVNGPVLYGYSGGGLATNAGGTQNVALQWDQNGDIGIGKPISTGERLCIQQNGGAVGIGIHSNINPLLRFYDTDEGHYGDIALMGSTGEMQFNRTTVGGLAYNFLNSSGTSIFSIFDDGKVGIGTKVPKTGLHIAKGSGSTVTSKTSGYLVLGDVDALNTVFDDNEITARNNSVASPLYLNVNGGDVILNKNTGNVGIGTGAPNAKLDVKGDLRVSNEYRDEGIILSTGSVGGAEDNSYDRIFMKENGDDTYGFSIVYNGGQDNATMSYPGNTFGITRHNGTVNGEIALAIQRSSGNVGIGTDAPTQAKLVVNGGIINNFAYAYLSKDGTSPKVDYNGGGNNPYSIYATQRIAATEFNAFSDSRIKEIKGLSNGSEDLGSLMDIKITNYRLIDSLAKGNKPYKKVIAQQLKEVYPQAVTDNLTEVIPDIYQKSNIENGWVDLATDLEIGEKVQLIFKDKKELLTVIDVKKGAFKVDTLERVEDVFVFGRQVNDFHSVDYEAISMLNVSATQEMYRQIQQLQKEKAEQKAQLDHQASELESLKKQQEELATQKAALEAQAAEIEEIKRALGLNVEAKK